MSRNLCKNIIFRFKAERIEASATREEQRQLTQRIREDVQRIEAQRIALIAQRERDLAELARIEAAAAQGVDPPLLTPNPEEQSIQVKIPSKPPIFSCLLAFIISLSWYKVLLRFHSFYG